MVLLNLDRRAPPPDSTRATSLAHFGSQLLKRLDRVERRAQRHNRVVAAEQRGILIGRDWCAFGDSTTFRGIAAKQRQRALRASARHSDDKYPYRIAAMQKTLPREIWALV